LKSRLGDSVTSTALACGKGLNSAQTEYKRAKWSGSTGLLSNCLRDLRLGIALYHLEAGISIYAFTQATYHT